MTIEQTVCDLPSAPGLHQLHLRPPSEIPEKGAFLFFHGLGDYIDRYPPFLKSIVNLGYHVCLTDLPGHGRSPGARGEIRSCEVILELAEVSVAVLPKGVPLGVCGHSMGGLLALWTFLQQLERFDFAWFSSPLLRPGHDLSPFQRSLMLTAARFFPRLGWSTGVKAADCAPPIPPAPSDEHAQSLAPPLFHARVSLGWARELAAISDDVWSLFPPARAVSDPAPLLFTQGTADRICPPEILDRFLEEAAATERTLQLLPDALHEPFRGPDPDGFSQILTDWFQKLPQR